MQMGVPLLFEWGCPLCGNPLRAKILYPYSMYIKMRHTLLVVLATLVLAAGILPAKAALAEGEYVPGEVIVVYEESAASMEQTDAELTDRGYEVMSACGSKPSEAPASASGQRNTIAVAETPEGVSVEQAVAEVGSLEGVAYAQPNYVYRMTEPMADVGATAVDLTDWYFKYEYLKNSSPCMVNAYKAVLAVQNVGLRTVDVPSAVGELIYTGLPHTDVTTHDGYTLGIVPYDPE